MLGAYGLRTLMDLRRGSHRWDGAVEQLELSGVFDLALSWAAVDSNHLPPR